MIGRIALLAAILIGGSPAFAGSERAPGAFDKWLNQDAPKCIPVSVLAKVGKVIGLTPAQFQFGRALYAAIPPISKELPPGDHAILIGAPRTHEILFALVSRGDDRDPTKGVACARFLLPDFLQKMLMQVGEGETGEAGPDL